MAREGCVLVVRREAAVNARADGVTAAEAMADPQPLAAELVARMCGTRAPGVLELLGMLGIDLTAGAPAPPADPAPAVHPDKYRKPTRSRTR